MSWIVSNWVERRAATERNLQNAAAMWRKANAALAEACESFQAHYPHVATVQRTKPDANLVLIMVTRLSASSVQADQALTSRVVAIKFKADKRKIIVTIDNKRTQEFVIQADSDHAFVSLEGRELQFDEFSRCALEEVFFNSFEPAHSSAKLSIVR